MGYVISHFILNNKFGRNIPHCYDYNYIVLYKLGTVSPHYSDLDYFIIFKLGNRCFKIIFCFINLEKLALIIEIKIVFCLL